ncbi:Hypothetical protein CINCED_3A006855 [Cinara cedri]|uniref:Uncharacterized protein n=1 Tax=Cinara cedri TaxID=506608 RepID=A0A5E4M8Y4_9HEMI|nr:Hypothetical protein CINCED_3A006855 [Cinara cedri]
MGEATITDIKNNRHAIMDFASKMDSGDGIKRRKVMKVAKYPNLDKAMEMWFIQKRSLNKPISSLQNEESDDSSSDESMGTPKGPTSAEAFAAFETGLEWFEKQAECCPTQLLLLKRLRDLVAEKRVAAHRQIKIDNFVKNI